MYRYFFLLTKIYHTLEVTDLNKRKKESFDFANELMTTKIDSFVSGKKFINRNLPPPPKQKY